MSKHQYSILIDVVISKLPGLKVNDSEFELGILHTGHIRMSAIAIQSYSERVYFLGQLLASEYVAFRSLMLWLRKECIFPF